MYVKKKNKSYYTISYFTEWYWIYCIRNYVYINDITKNELNIIFELWMYIYRYVYIYTFILHLYVISYCVYNTFEYDIIYYGIIFFVIE